MDFEAGLDAQSALLGLRIAAEHRPGVLRYLQLAAEMAARVTDFELTPADESGSVFVPVSPSVGRDAA
jgi:1-carboxybiuret hydrolase subunit AtzG-like